MIHRCAVSAYRTDCVALLQGTYEDVLELYVRVFSIINYFESTPGRMDSSGEQM